jgi:Porphobilinogen deaminase
MLNKIIIGSRGSKLSMAYANRVKSLLLKNSKNLLKTIEIKAVKTSGDIFQNKKISEIGGKNLFCKEIEEKLIKKQIDIAVHS